MVSVRLGFQPQEEPLTKAHALFYKGFKEVDGNESQITVVCGKIQISFFVGNAMSANTLLKEKVLQEKAEYQT